MSEPASVEMPKTIDIDGRTYDRSKLVQWLAKELAKMDPDECKRVLGQ